MSDFQTPRPAQSRRGLRVLISALGFLALGVMSMVIALVVTPAVSVSVFGQTVDVGSVPVYRSLSPLGPGEAELFGEGTIETVQEFRGPIRPRITWQQFDRNDAAAAFIQSSASDGKRVIQSGTAQAGELLADGWGLYFVRLVAIASAIGGALYLAGVGAIAIFAGQVHHHHRSRRFRLAQLSVAVAMSLLVTTGFAALTISSAVAQLGSIRSLSDLVGTSALSPIPAAVGPARPDVEIVVIGDSTAAGVGNKDLKNPTADDTDCRRSRDAFANSLQSATGRTVLNLACSSATIRNGLLGPQTTGGREIEPQVGRLRAIKNAAAVVVSIGANDVGWADFMRLCYGLPRCDDQATDSLFQRRLDDFKIQYSQLLQTLGALPGHPTIVINQYYSPFGDTFDCPALQDPAAPDGGPPGYGLAANPGQNNQDEKIKQKVNPIKSQLTRMNSVIEAGAKAFGFATVLPSFEGHELCSDQPWVQGMSDPAPFHPTAAGELAIAAADLPHVELKTATLAEVVGS